MSPRLTKLISLFISFCLIFDQAAYALEPAQNTPSLYASSLNVPLPDKLINLSPSYQPVALRGLRFYPDDPFRLDFILDEGQVEPDELKLKTEASVLIKYFLSSLTIPEEDLLG